MASSKIPVPGAPDSLTSRMRKMEWRVTSIHDQALKPHGVNMYQAMSLIYISWHGKQESVNQRSIERFLYLSNPGVSKIVVFLEREGYITRTPDPKDARCYLLTATDQGDAFAATLSDAIYQADKDILSPLNPQEQQTLLKLLEKIGGAQMPSGG